MLGGGGEGTLSTNYNKESFHDLKIWDADSGSCLSTALCGYGVTIAFAPGGRYVLVGSKEGALQVILTATRSHLPHVSGAAIPLSSSLYFHVEQYLLMNVLVLFSATKRSWVDAAFGFVTHAQ